MINIEKQVNYYIAQENLKISWQSHDADRIRYAIAYQKAVESDCTKAEIEQLHAGYLKTKAQEEEQPTFEEVIDYELEYIEKEIKKGNLFTSFKTLQTINQNDNVTDNQRDYIAYLIRSLDSKFKKMELSK